MQEAWLMFTLSFLAGCAGGFLGAMSFLYRFSRRCTSLEWAIGDLQQRASTFKGKEMADKRWSKEKTFDAEMAQILSGANPVGRKKFDNDPLGE